MLVLSLDCMCKGQLRLSNFGHLQPLLSFSVPRVTMFLSHAMVFVHECGFIKIMWGCMGFACPIHDYHVH